MFKVLSRYMREHVKRKVVRQKGKIDNVTKKQKSYCYCFCDKSFFPDYFKRVNKRFGDCRRTLVGVREKDKERDTDDTSKTAAHLRNSWIEAIRWSGTLAFGWAVSQNFHLYVRRRRLQEYVTSYQFDNITSHEYLCPHRILKNILISNVSAQPNDFVDVKSILNAEKISVSQTSLPVFGPKTADQALNEATEGVKKVRNEAVGELENRLGLRCMSKQRYRKAVIHFAAGSALQNSSATFNLAQCYELGLGTRQDYEKAAKCYHTASNQGNASATYNLAVFYAHGYGGLKTDRNKALQLLQRAVTLGEPNAKQLLERYVYNNNRICTKKENELNTTQKKNEKTEAVALSETRLKFPVIQLPLAPTKLKKVNSSTIEHCSECNSVSTDDGLVSEYESSNSSISYSDSSCQIDSSKSLCYDEITTEKLNSSESRINMHNNNNTSELNNRNYKISGFPGPVPSLAEIYRLVTASTFGR